MIIRLNGSTRAPRVIWGSPPRSGTFLVWCFLMRVTLVGGIAYLNFRILKHQNQDKYKVLGQCWLRCLPRGGVVADNLKLRIPKHMLRKACNYAGLGVLFFPNLSQATPEPQTGTQAAHSPEVPRGSQQAWFATSDLRICYCTYLLQFKCN